MLSEHQALASVFQVDRPLHHELAMATYRQSFRMRNLTERYEQSEFRRLKDVFTMVTIGDNHLPSVKRNVDTFDLINPYLASKLIEACYRDLPSQARAIACLKSIDRYCRFLKECSMIHIPGQKSIYLPEIYGPVESPVNRYTIPRQGGVKPPSRNYLEASEYKFWLRFTWSQIKPGSSGNQLLKASQLHLMCVIAGEMGLRLQEILGLQLEHFSFEEGVCLVTNGKGSRGSGYRKRTVPFTDLVKATLQGFLAHFERGKGERLFQSPSGELLSKHTAHHWMSELIEKIKAARLPILIEPGFGWHAFRRTYTRMFIEKGGNIMQLKRNTGWTFTSTISHYLGDSKQSPVAEKLPSFMESVDCGD